MFPLPHQLNDPVWRLSSGFYTIRSEDGKPIPFIPTPQQRRVIYEVYVLGHRIIAIPKARQVRMSTLICLMCLDTILFGSSVQVSIVDKDVPSAKKKMEEKIWYAWDRLPSELRSELWEEMARSLHPVAVFTVRHKRFVDGPASTSTIYAGDNARGGTNQLLFFTEWAEVAVRQPVKSREYLHGAWPSAECGLRIIETTWSGGKSGDVWGVVSAGIDKATGLPLPDKKMREGIPRILFFPWYVIPERRIEGDPDEVRQEIRDYFDDIMRQTGDVIDDSQMLWYQRKVVDVLGHDGRHTYPSIIHECWDGKIEGSIWGDALSRARHAGAVGNLPHDPTRQVDTFWDLGAPENQPCLYVQHIAGNHRVITLDDGLPDILQERVKRLLMRQEQGFQYGTHFLPHDAHQRQRNGRTFRDEFESELLRQGVSGRVVVLERTLNKLHSINYATVLIRSGLEFHEPDCGPLLEAMAAFRWKPDPSREGKFLDEFVKDWSSHLADALVYIAEAHLAQHLPTNSNTTMLNLYFDAPILDELSQAMPSHPESRWLIENHGSTFRTVSGAPSAEYGWLRIWQTPAPALPFLVTVSRASVSVWRGSFRDTLGNNHPASLAAACVAEDSIQSSVLYRWASLASAYYGNCPVVADITALPDSVEELKKLGVAVLARRQPLTDRRLGQQGADIRKPGHTFSEKEYQSAMQGMQAMLRDRQAVLWCPVSLRQMQSITVDRDGFPILTDGARDNWVKNHALALSCITSACPAMVGRGIDLTPRDYAPKTGPKKKVG